MKRAARLLREPPESFRLAARGLHQDIVVICEEQGIGLEQHMLDFVEPGAYSNLLGYLNEILGDESVSNADLRGLLNRQDPDWRTDAKGARKLFEAMQLELRKRLNHDA